jgi:hypothetical protein
MSRTDDTTSVARSESRKYLAKAQEFLATAGAAASDERWNSAALAAIHAGISAADAAIVASAGVRSSSKDHAAAVALLRRLVPESGATQERQLSGLLNMKNTVEYEQRLAVEAEARSLVQQAGRLVRWAASVVASHLD